MINSENAGCQNSLYFSAPDHNISLPRWNVIVAKKSCFRTTHQSLSFWYHHFITASIDFLILGDSSLPKEFDCEGQWDDWNCLIQIAPIWTCWDLYPSEWCLNTKLYIFGICWIYLIMSILMQLIWIVSNFNHQLHFPHVLPSKGQFEVEIPGLW